MSANAESADAESAAAPPALLLAALGSGAGKSVAALALLAAYRAAGRRVVSAKSGPDYLDPTFHAAAAGAPSFNLDAWAMSVSDLRARAAESAAGAELLLIEGAMGLLDGAPDKARPEGRGSAADLAAALGAPVVLVIDIARMAQSVAAIPLGLKAARPDLAIAGAVLNRAGSPRHAALARRALESAGCAVFGALPRSDALSTPSRHLGLVPAHERGDLQSFLEGAARLATEHVDLCALASAARPLSPPGAAPRRLAPLGQRIAVARDAAFAFAYPHLLSDWRAQGAELEFFAPLRNEPPPEACDAVFLPGGYPELHAPLLSAADMFRGGLARARGRGALIYGECGGHMALGQGLIDADGRRWAMAGLLPHSTSFAERRLHLGYRMLRPAGPAPLFDRLGAKAIAGHEFHYATETGAAAAAPLFSAEDAEGAALEPMGCVDGMVCGSFAHIVAPGATA